MKRIDRKLEKMNGELNKLLQDLSGLNQRVLTQRPNESAWSILEILQHLMFAEKGSLRYVRKKLSYDPNIKEVDLKTRFRTFVFFNVFKMPIKFSAPRIVAEDKFRANTNLKAITQEWQNDRAEMKKFLSSLPEDTFKKQAYRHAAAGRMSLWSMVEFFDIHFKRHLKQINKNLKALNSN